MEGENRFRDSLTAMTPPDHYSACLKSLWYDAKDDWGKAHDQVDQLSGVDAAWVHAYLHRKEGDLWNADYWYARAKKARPSVSLEVEFENLLAYFN